MVQQSELAQLNPQFLSKGLLKRVSIAERRNRKRSNKAESKKKPDERQSQRTNKTTHNNKRKRKASFCF